MAKFVFIFCRKVAGKLDLGVSSGVVVLEGLIGVLGNGVWGYSWESIWCICVVVLESTVGDVELFNIGDRFRVLGSPCLICEP